MKKNVIKKLKRILVVDDDQDIRLALRALLRDADYEVVGEAAEGIRALELLDKHSPSIVLLDIMMPGMSGLDVLVKIKQSHPLTKVVMISGDATSEHVTASLARGATGFIVKPFNFNNVIKNIERALVEAVTAIKDAHSKDDGGKASVENVSSELSERVNSEESADSKVDPDINPNVNPNKIDA